MDIAYLSGDESTSDPDIPTPYLANYAMHKHLRASAFVYFPWRPARTQRAALDRALAAAMAACRALPLAPRLRWLPVASSRPVAFGKHGYSNVQSVKCLHVSVFPNLLVDSDKVERMWGVRVGAPPQLVGQKTLALAQMLEKPAPVLRLGLVPRLKTYMSSRTGTVFVAMDIDERARPYLAAVTRAVKQRADAAGARYSWAQMVQGDFLGDVPDIRYHCTIATGECKVYGERLLRVEFAELRRAVEAVSVPALEMEVETLAVTSGKHTHETRVA